MKKIKLQQIIDDNISIKKHQRDLSWGWTAVIWLAYVLSEGDHRKVAVREYIRGMQYSLSKLTGQKINELDFADDRLTNLLGYLSDKKSWEAIEKSLSENSIEVHELPKKIARVDATTASGYHKPIENGLFQFGNSKDDPNRPQLKIMTGSLDPLGMPLASDVVSGEKADDGLYVPIINRIHSILSRSGVLYIGDCKLSSFDNRLHIRGKIEGHYLCPLPNTGKIPEQMQTWINDGNKKDDNDALIKYTVINKKGEEVLKAKGYELEREQSGRLDEKKIIWKERVLVVKSPAHERQQVKGLQRRIENAEKETYALTPPRGPGKRQIVDEAILIEKRKAIFKKHRVEKYLTCEYEKEVERKEKYVGRGRGGKDRKTIIEERVRYQVTNIIRNTEAIKSTKKTFGWKAFVTDVSKERLDFISIVKSYRKQYSVERIFNRLKSRLNIAPFYVKRDDQAKGMAQFLTIGVRIYTLIEFVARRSLKKSGEKLIGLHLENPKKASDIPTCEKILKAFKKITLTIIDNENNTQKHLTPLSKLQENILRHLGIDAAIYINLQI